MSETPDQGGNQPRQQPPSPSGSGDQYGGPPSWGEQPPYGQDPGHGQQPGYGQDPGFGQQQPGSGQASYGQQAWAPAAPTAPAEVTGSAPVLVHVEPAAAQNRLTVLIRLIMVIPASIVLGFVSIGAEVVAFIGWWAALFTGHLPTWAFDFLTGHLRWTARLQGYSYLLTDK